MADDKIAASIIDYIDGSLKTGQAPNRSEAIRSVTGALPVMPSQVAKEITRMVEAGILGLRQDGQISIKK